MKVITVKLTPTEYIAHIRFNDFTRFTPSRVSEVDLIWSALTIIKDRYDGEWHWTESDGEVVRNYETFLV